MEKTLTFNLSKIIKYAKDGKNVETGSLEFVPPGMDIFNEISMLSQLVMRAALEARQYAPEKKESDTKEAAEDQKMDAKTIKLLLFSSKNVSFKSVANVFKDIAYKTGTTDGTIKIKKVIFERLTIDDFTNLVCEYIANFICPSLF